VRNWRKDVSAVAASFKSLAERRTDMDEAVQELVEVLRALMAASGHEGAGPNRCAFNTVGCTCGRTEKQRIALADANRVLRDWRL
jgi:hypothetical protein